MSNLDNQATTQVSEAANQQELFQEAADQAPAQAVNEAVEHAAQPDADSPVQVNEAGQGELERKEQEAMRNAAIQADAELSQVIVNQLRARLERNIGGLLTTELASGLLTSLADDVSKIIRAKYS